MPLIRLTTFKGQIPSYAPNLLPDQASVIAMDCHFDDGTLHPIEVSKDTLENVPVDTVSMFRYEDQYWFSWGTDVDVIKSPVARDQWRRVYWTDGAYPKVTYNTIFNGQGQLPVAHYKLGVPAPTKAPVIDSFTKPLDEESAVTVYYVTTFVTGVGEEGAPSAPSKEINCHPIGVEIGEIVSDLDARIRYDNGKIKITDKYGTELKNFSYDETTGLVSWSDPAPESGIEIVINAYQDDVAGKESPTGSYTATIIVDGGTGPNNPSGAPVVDILNDADKSGVLTAQEISSGTINMTVKGDDVLLKAGGAILINVINKIKESSNGDVGKVDITIYPPGTNNNNIERVRLYRLTSGAGAAEFLLVADLPISQTKYTDIIPDGSLGAILETEEYATPPDGMLGLCAMANGICAGFIDNQVLFSEPYLPYAWPEGYRLSIDSDVVAIEAIGTSLVVGTTGDPYLFTGISPGNIANQKLEISQACVSKRSMKNIGPAVLYASPDGLVAIAPDGVRMITDNIIGPMQWRSMLDPSTIEAYRHESRYIGIHSKGAFILDIVAGDFRLLNDSWKGGYTDPSDDTLYFVDNGKIMAFRKGDQYKSLTWRSKEFDAINVGFNCCRIDADDILKVSFKLIVDGKVEMTKPIGTMKQTFTLPAKRGDNWQFELESTTRIKSIKLATSKQELKT